MEEIVLVQGSNYGINGKVFRRNVPKEVTPETRTYLLGTGRFRPVAPATAEAGDEIKIGKGIVIKHTKKKKASVGDFKTKAAAFAWALDNYGVELNTRLAIRTLNGQCLALVGGKARDSIKGAKIVADGIPVEDQVTEQAESLN